MKTKFEPLYTYVVPLILNELEVSSRLKGNYLNTRIKPFKKFYGLDKNTNLLVLNEKALREEFETQNKFDTNLSFEDFNRIVVEIFKQDLILDYNNVILHVVSMCDDIFECSSVTEQEKIVRKCEKEYANLCPKNGASETIEEWYEHQDVAPNYHDYDDPKNCDRAWTSYLNAVLEDKLYASLMKYILKNYWMLPEKEYNGFLENKQYIEELVAQGVGK